MFLVATGTIGAVESRRRRRLRSAPDHARLPLPTRSVMQMERALRALSRPELLTRLDLAVRGAAAALAGTAEHAGAGPAPDAARWATPSWPRSAAVVHAAIVGADGRIELYLSGPAPAPAPFVVGELDASPARWILPSDVTTDDIPCGARFAPFPSPLLVQVASADAGEVFVDLEATGLLTIDGERRDEVARGVSAGISVSPFADAASVIAVGAAVGDPWADIADRIMLAADADAAVDLAAGTIGPVLGVLRPGDTTFALRSLAAVSVGSRRSCCSTPADSTTRSSANCWRSPSRRDGASVCSPSARSSVRPGRCGSGRVVGGSNRSASSVTRRPDA